ncbi:hypothetical protein [Brevibacillus sp. H7]|uniref:hypothetical protein n=1 Tax=Brevibacillus sp. H7 TaxID=3349138 RepID=UPI003826E943
MIEVSITVGWGWEETFLLPLSTEKPSQYSQLNSRRNRLLTPGQRVRGDVIV